MNGSLQVKNGYYYIVLGTTEIKGGNKTYGQKWISTGLKERGNKRKAQQMLQQILAGTAPTETEQSVGGTPFREYVEHWAEYRKNDKKHPITQKTYESYEQLNRTHIIPYFTEHDLTVEELRTSHINEFFDYLLTKVSVNTVKHIRVNVTNALKLAVKEELIRTNPALNAEALPRMKRYNGTAYSEKELINLFNACKDTKLETPIKLAATYGLRRSEVLGLRWDDIDFTNNVIHIQHTAIQLNNEICYSDSTKSETSRRDLPLTETVKKYLQVLKNVQTEKFGMHKYVCLDEYGEPLKPRYVSHAFNKLLEKNDLPHIRFHDLRHSAATNLIKAGCSLEEVKEWLGHSSISVTADIYTHMDFAMKQQTADLLSATKTMQYFE